MGEIVITIPRRKHKVQIIKSEAVLNEFLAKQEASIKQRFGVFDLDLSVKDGLEDLIPEETTTVETEIVLDEDLPAAKNIIENKISDKLLEEDKNDVDEDVINDVEKEYELEYTESSPNKIIFTEIYTIADDNEPIKINNDFETKNMVATDDLEKHIQSAYDKGYDDAKEIALLNAREKVMESHNYIRRIDSFMADLREHYVIQTQQMKDKIIEIGTTIAEIILEAEINKDNSFITKQIARIFDEINNEKVFSIRINPADYNILIEVKSNLLNNDNNIAFIKDDNIQKGSCVLNTAMGNIDATISTQINKLKNEIIAMEKENIPTKDELVSSAVPDIIPTPESILMKNEEKLMNDE